MILLAHIVIALASVAYTTYLFFVPSKSKLTVSYWLIGLTLGTGTILVISNPAHMLQACMSGIAYVALMTAGVALVRHKLAYKHLD